MAIWIWIIIGIGAVVLLYLIGTYNSLIVHRTRSEEAWSDIDVQLKRRFDLIPNIVNAVKGYAKHEKEVFEKVTAARADVSSAKDLKERSKAENELTKTLRSIFAVAENYPDLKANQNFLKLQEELSETENKIEASRRFYNANVRDLNIKIKSFPSNLVANTFKFEPKELFELSALQKDEANKAPKIEF